MPSFYFPYTFILLSSCGSCFFASLFAGAGPICEYCGVISEFCYLDGLLLLEDFDRSWEFTWLYPFTVIVYSVLERDWDCLVQVAGKSLSNVSSLCFGRPL